MHGGDQLKSGIKWVKYFFGSRYFESLLLSEAQDACKESQHKNTLDARTVKML
jgi:hypothetical protein